MVYTPLAVYTCAKSAAINPFTAVRRLKQLMLARKSIANPVIGRRGFLGDLGTLATTTIPKPQVAKSTLNGALALGALGVANPTVSRGQFLTTGTLAAGNAAKGAVQSRVPAAISQQLGASAVLLPGSYSRRQFLGRLMAAHTLDPVARVATDVTTKGTFKVPEFIANNLT